MRISDANKWIGAEVVTEDGNLLGWVCQIHEEGDRLFLVISTIPILWVPQIFATIGWLSCDEIMAMGAKRLIVRQTSEERLINKKIGVLERFGFPLSQPEDKYKTTTPNSGWHSLEDYDDYDDGDYDDGLGIGRRSRRPKTPKPTDGSSSADP